MEFIFGALAEVNVELILSSICETFIRTTLVAIFIECAVNAAAVAIVRAATVQNAIFNQEVVGININVRFNLALHLLQGSRR